MAFMYSYIMAKVAKFRSVELHHEKRIGTLTHMDTTTLIIAGTVIAVLNYISVFSALATLRWKDARDKRKIANVFIQEVGAKLQNEADFQNIINNLRIQDIRNDEEDNK
jgi:hypothetical protein